MTTKIHISDVVFVDLGKTPKRLVDRAAATAREKHTGVSVQYVSESTTTVLTQGGSGQGGRVEISKSLFTKGEAEGWRKRTKEAMTSVADAKQTLVCELHRLREFVEILKDVYGFEPIKGGE